MYKLLQQLHSFFVFSRRTEIIANSIARLLPANAYVLDIGCGDGTIDKKIINIRPDIKAIGVDVFKRKRIAIPVTVFDGKHLPFTNRSFDCVLFIDTLHHMSGEDQIDLLKDAIRVTRKSIIIKDHYLQNKISFYTLKLMDWVGNKPHHVHLPFNYLRPAEWEKLYKNFNLKKDREITYLNLYPFPFNLVFDRNYHFIAALIHDSDS